MQLPLIYYFTVWEHMTAVKTAIVVFTIQNHAREAAGCCLDDLINCIYRMPFTVLNAM